MTAAAPLPGSWKAGAGPGAGLVGRSTRGRSLCAVPASRAHAAFFPRAPLAPTRQPRLPACPLPRVPPLHAHRVQHQLTAKGVCWATEAWSRLDTSAKPSPGEMETRKQKARNTIPLHFRGGNIETAAGLPILTNIDGGFSLTEGPDGNGDSQSLVLGYTAAHSTNFLETAIGQLQCSRLLSCGRCKLWWMTPEWGTTAQDIPPETQFLLIEVQEGGPYAIVLPLISDQTFRGSLRPPSRGQNKDTLFLRMETNSEMRTGSVMQHALVVHASWDLFALVDEAVAVAASYSGGSRPLAEKQLPGSIDVFGWCTWDAFYSKVSALGIRQGLESLAQGGVSPKWLVIDDGWQQTDVDKELREMFGDKNIIPEEVWEAERQALSTTADELVAQGSGSSTYSIAATVTASAEEETRVRKQMRAEYMQEAKDLSLKDPQGINAIYNWIKRGLWSAIDIAIGWAIGLGEAAGLRLYQRVIEPAPPGSLPAKLFTWLANGPLKPAMLQFFCASGDFSKRLVDVTANSKFASPYSGPMTQDMVSDLGSVIRAIKTDFGVKYVYCWHGLPGYWGGISPDSPFTKRFNPKILPVSPMPGVLEVEPSQAWGPAALAGIGVVDDIADIYESMHSYLAAEGVDGVKVDCQAGIGLVPCSDGTPHKSAQYQYALEESVKKHFPGNHLINCMCHDTENFYRFTNSAIARACDDFYPRDKASHTAHIANSAYNSLFLGAIVQPDWDMFQSSHPANLLHAAARAVSGAAVYVSDKPGRHDFELLRRLVLPDGSVLRAIRPGRPTVDCVFKDVMRDGRSLLKVWNMNSCSGIVGVFNVQGSSWDRNTRSFRLHDSSPPTLEETVKVEDVWGKPSAAGSSSQEVHHVAFCSNSGALYRLSGEAAGVPVRLEAGGSEVVTLVEVQRCLGVEFAALGLIRMLNPGGAVLSTAGQASSGSVTFTVGFRGCGTFAAAVGSAPSSCRIMPGGAELTVDYDEAKGTASVELPELAGLRGELTFTFRAVDDREE